MKLQYGFRSIRGRNDRANLHVQSVEGLLIIRKIITSKKDQVALICTVLCAEGT